MDKNIPPPFIAQGYLLGLCITIINKDFSKENYRWALMIPQGDRTECDPHIAR